jgi:hypothetical protein
LLSLPSSMFTCGVPGSVAGDTIQEASGSDNVAMNCQDQLRVMAKQTGAKLARLDVNATGEDARVAEQAAKISGQMAERRKADIFWTVDCFIAGDKSM